jgi:beta-phosphoglucomutase-like phosphatase (HAD superfamily)
VSVAWRDETTRDETPADFNRLLNFRDADEAAEEDLRTGPEPRDFHGAPPDFQEDEEDLDVSNAPDVLFLPSPFDVEPALRGPLAREKELDPQMLNMTYEASGAQRLKNLRNPQRAYGMIMELEVLAPYTELYCTIWNEVALEHDLPLVTEDEVKRAMANLGVDAAIREFQWTFDREEALGLLTDFQARLKSAVQDKPRLATFAEVSVGATRWLDLVKEEEIKAAIVGRHSSDVLRDLANAAGLTDFMIVSVEDNLDSLEQAFLSAAAKLETAPSACCAFGASPKSVSAAHNALMKGVSIAGVHPRYELSVSDLIIGSFEEMNLDKVRAVMSTNELPDYQLEPELQPEPDRFTPRTMFD